MLYQPSLDIERRLETVLSLIRSGDYSTPMIARQLHVSIPTASRYVTALRERGTIFMLNGVMAMAVRHQRCARIRKRRHPPNHGDDSGENVEVPPDGNT